MGSKLVFAAGILSLAAAVCLILWMRSKLLAFTEKTTATLDDMIRGKPDIVFEMENDTLIDRMQAKLGRLYEILRSQSVRNQEEKLEIQGLVSDISHQVKTPIANIKMYSSILSQRQMEPEKQQEFLASIEKQIDKLDSLIQSMIKMSRLETGIIQVHPRDEAIHPIIAQAVCGAALKAEAKGIELTVRCEEHVRAKCDAKWTAEAVFNILDNAVKYTPDGGTVRIDVYCREFFTKIDVTDTGIGIEEEHYADIFKRFHREPEVHEEEGVGIGLYLAREIITRQGGYIEVRSRKGIGSVFSVFLPEPEN